MRKSSLLPDAFCLALPRGARSHFPSVADIYRRHARYLSWYDDDGEATNRNPFKKFRARPKHSRTSALESGLRPVRTEGDARLSQERQRNQEFTDGLHVPPHADTFSPESSGLLDPRAGVEENANSDGAGLEPSPKSNEPINVSQAKDDPDEGGPRQRKAVAKSIRNDDDTLTGKSRESTEDKQQFTVVGQLKATLFNSWVNILLVMAPVGSKKVTVPLQAQGSPTNVVSHCQLPSHRSCWDIRHQFHCYNVCHGTSR